MLEFFTSSGTSAWINRFCYGNLFDQRIDTSDMLRGMLDDRWEFGIVVSAADYEKTSLERLLACISHILSPGHLVRDCADRLNI